MSLYHRKRRASLTNGIRELLWASLPGDPLLLPRPTRLLCSLREIQTNSSHLIKNRPDFIPTFPTHSHTHPASPTPLRRYRIVRSIQKQTDINSNRSITLYIWSRTTLNHCLYKAKTGKRQKFHMVKLIRIVILGLSYIPFGSNTDMKLSLRVPEIANVINIFNFPNPLNSANIPKFDQTLASSLTSARNITSPRACRRLPRHSVVESREAQQAFF